MILEVVKTEKKPNGASVFKKESKNKSFSVMFF